MPAAATAKTINNRTVGLDDVQKQALVDAIIEALRSGEIEPMAMAVNSPVEFKNEDGSYSSGNVPQTILLLSLSIPAPVEKGFYYYGNS